MHRRFLAMVKDGKKALSYVPQYPPSAAQGLIKAPGSKVKLQQVDVPNLPFNVYQDPETGHAYSGPLYDAGMLGWAQQHMQNADVAYKLSLAYLLTGGKEYAEGAAAILRAYIDRYLKLPLVANTTASSAVGSAASGVLRINSSYMHERRWLGNLAIALDNIRAAKVLSATEIESIRSQVFVPSASTMMDHKVGVMNLQWMIQSGSLFAGLATDDGALVARALYDRHGIERLTQLGFLDDGQWWENPSYQGVAKLAAYPALAPALHNGLLAWGPQYERLLKAAYKLHGPDGLSPTLGTGGYRNLRFEDTGVFIFSKLIRDPELVHVLYHRKPSTGTYGLLDFALFRQEPPKLAQEKTVDPVPDTTVHLPAYGGVAMRVPGTDRYCYVHYGRELVHGHRNKLSINAYGAGGWYARNIVGGYGHHFKTFLETVASSNTIMVDGVNPDADTGELLFLESVDGAELLSARELGAYKDVEHERSVVLTAGPLIVLDRCKSEIARTYDWLHHANMTGLQLDRAGTPGAPVVLGETPIYSGLQSIGSAPTTAVLHWPRPEDRRYKQGGGLRSAYLGPGQLVPVHVDKKHATRAHDGVVWRQSGQTVAFAALFWPYAGEAAGEISIRAEAVVNAAGKAVDLAAGQAVTVTTPEGSWSVLVNYSGQPLTAAGITTGKRVAVRKH
jgi:hypothetical protein